jgi:DNA-binding transcriptional MerR regulator
VELDKAWKITEFSKLVDKHYNTVDQWFKALEDKHIHYVSRVAGEKVYDEQDLEIGKYIKESRDKGYSLQLIFEQLPEVYALRTFPPEWISGDTPWDIDAFRKNLELKFESRFIQLKDELKEEAIAAARSIFEDQQKALPAPKSYEEVQSERVTDQLTRLKVEKRLEEKAIEAWSKLPEAERLKKVGLFRKDEDWGKRDSFIRNFIREKIEIELKIEYGLG